MGRVLEIDQEHPDLSLLDLAVRVVREGGVIAFPTETYYGLGADVLNTKAIESIFQIKRRDRGNPLLVLTSSFSQTRDLVKEIPSVAWPLMNRFWPGPLTLVFEASGKVSPLVTASTGKIGIRIPGNPLTWLLLKRAAVPMTATSANRSGGPNPVTAEAVLRDLGGEVALILDAGPTPGGKPSTVVDVTTTPVTIIRRGKIPEDLLK